MSPGGAWRSLVAAGLVGAVLPGCRQAGGAGAVARALSSRYGERAFELDVRAEADGRTVVAVTLRDARTDDPTRAAAEIAGLVRREFPLTGARDSVIVRLSTEANRGALRTRRLSTFRFEAREPP